MKPSQILPTSFDKIYRFKNLVRVLFLFLLFFCFYQIQFLEFKAQKDLDPSFFKSVQTLKEFEKEFMFDPGFALILSKKDGTFLSDKDYCLFRDWFDGLGSEHPLIQNILNPLDLNRPMVFRNKLQNGPVFGLDCGFQDKNPRPSPLLKTPWKGVLTDLKGKDILVFINFKKEGLSSEKVIDFFEKEILSSKKMNLDYQIHLTGKSSGDLYISQAYQNDGKVNLVILLILLFTVRYFSGKWSTSFYMVSSLVAVGGILFGLMSFFKVPLTILSSSIFLLVCLSGIQDYFFLLHFQTKNPELKKESFKKLINPCFFTSLTTLIGYGALIFSPLEIIREFGLWCGIGVLLEWIVLFFILPSFLKGSVDLVDSEKAASLKWVQKFSEKELSPFFKKIFFIFFILSFFGITKITIDESPSKNFGKDHPSTKAIDYLKKSRGWEGQLSLIFDKKINPKEEAIILKKLNKHKGIIAILNFNDNVTDLENSLPPELKNQARTISEKSIEYNFFYGNNKVRSYVLIKKMELKWLKELLSFIRSTCKGLCRPVGTPVLYEEFTFKVLDHLFRGIIIVIILVNLIISGLIYFILPSFKPKILYSAFWGPVVMIGLLGYFQIPLALTNSMLIIVLIGLTGDNAIHYIFSSQGSSIKLGLKEKGKASLEISLFVIFCCFLFVFVSFVPMKLFGLYLAFGLSLSLLGDFWILKEKF